MKNKGSEIKAYKIVKDSEKLLPNEGAIEQKYEKSWINKGGYIFKPRYQTMDSIVVWAKKLGFKVWLFLYE